MSRPVRRQLVSFDDELWVDRHFQHPVEENVFDDSSSPSSPQSNDNDENNDEREGKNSTEGSDADTTADDDEGNPSTENATTTAANGRDPTPPPPQTTAPLPPCQRINDAGHFFASPQAAQDFATGTNTRTTIVSFHYQIQGSLALNVPLLRTTVLPAVERRLTALLVPQLFGTQSCSIDPVTVVQLQPKQSIASSQSQPDENSDKPVTVDGGIRLRRGLALDGSFHNDAPDNAPVTGMQSEPADTLLPNIEGVRCRTALFGTASRCFVLTGAYSLSGPESMDWAVPIAQRATEWVMNEQGALDDSHPMVEHVLYLEGLPDGSSLSTRPPTIPLEPASQSQGDRISTGWSWIIVGSALSTLLFAIVLCRRYRARRESNHNATRGYQAYPSPDRSMSTHQSPRRTLARQGDRNVADAWDDPSATFDKAPIVSFDPVSGHPLANLVDNEPDYDELHDGSFPSDLPPSPLADALYRNNDDDDEEESAVLAFFDNDEDHNDLPAAPSSSWLRDLV